MKLLLECVQKVSLDGRLAEVTKIMDVRPSAAKMPRYIKNKRANKSPAGQAGKIPVQPSRILDAAQLHHETRQIAQAKHTDYRRDPASITELIRSMRGTWTPPCLAPRFEPPKPLNRSEQCFSAAIPASSFVCLIPGYFRTPTKVSPFSVVQPESGARARRVHRMPNHIELDMDGTRTAPFVICNCEAQCLTGD